MVDIGEISKLELKFLESGELQYTHYNITPHLISPIYKNNDYRNFNGMNYFSPKFYFEIGFIDDKLISSLEKGASVLDPCCGPSVLEDFLVLSSNAISPEQFDIADLFYNELSSNYKSERFSIYGVWPELEKEYDYILFPMIPFNPINEKFVPMLHNAIDSALTNLDKNGEIRICCGGENYLESFNLLEEKYGINYSAEHKIMLIDDPNFGYDKIFMSTITKLD